MRGGQCAGSMTARLQDKVAAKLDSQHSRPCLQSPPRIEHGEDPKRPRVRREIAEGSWRLLTLLIARTDDQVIVTSMKSCSRGQSGTIGLQFRSLIPSQKDGIGMKQMSYCGGKGADKEQREAIRDSEEQVDVDGNVLDCDDGVQHSNDEATLQVLGTSAHELLQH